MQFKFSSDRGGEAWRCCFCCHVRTGTLFLGIWHLVLHILALSVIAVILLHPEVLEKDSFGVRDSGNNGVASGNNPMLPTPLSKVEEPLLEIVGNDFELSFSAAESGSEESRTPSRLDGESYLFRDMLAKRRLNCQDLNVGIAVTFCTFAITVLMVYGAVKGKPSYLMPFFCLQVFDFCISSLTMIGYFSYLPDVHQLIAANPNLPWQQELLRMDPQLVGLFVLLTFVLTIMVKAYFIGVVWNCYKYLSLCHRASEGVIHFIDPADSRGGLLSSPCDLPDYETAVNDPQYSKKPLLPTTGLPPPYSAVVNLPPEGDDLVSDQPAEAMEPAPAAAQKQGDPAV